MQFFSGRKRQRCLYLSTVSEEELLGVGGEAAQKPTVHPVAHFSKKRVEEARVMQLDLVKEVIRSGAAVDQKSGKDDDETTRVHENSPAFAVHQKEKEVTEKGNANKTDYAVETFDMMQKAYTELGQLLDLSHALHGEKYMTLLTSTRTTLKSVGTEVPVMQRIALSKCRMLDISKQMHTTSKIVSKIIKQRQQYTSNILGLKKAWKLDAYGGAIAQRALHRRSLLAIDCSPMWMPSNVPAFVRCLVPLQVKEDGELFLSIKEQQHECQSIVLNLVSTDNKLCASVSNWEMSLKHLPELFTSHNIPSSLNNIHQHCQQRQVEMLDTGLMLCLRQDAGASNVRWVISPPLENQDNNLDASAAHSNSSGNAFQVGKLCEQLEIHAVHRSEVVVRISSKLILSIKMQRTKVLNASAPEDDVKGDNFTSINNKDQRRLQRILQTALLKTHLKLFNSVSKLQEQPVASNVKTPSSLSDCKNWNLLPSLVDAVKVGLVGFDSKIE